jgi:hypothetical protein
LSTSCARQSAFSTDVAGSVPNRHVPAWWATPATGISFFMYAKRWIRWSSCMSSFPRIDFSFLRSSCFGTSFVGV